MVDISPKKKPLIKRIVLGVITVIALAGSFVLGGKVDLSKAFETIVSGDASEAVQQLEDVTVTPVEGQ